MASDDDVDVGSVMVIVYPRTFCNNSKLIIVLGV